MADSDFGPSAWDSAPWGNGAAMHVPTYRPMSDIMDRLEGQLPHVGQSPTSAMFEPPPAAYQFGHDQLWGITSPNYNAPRLGAKFLSFFTVRHFNPQTTRPQP